jgi:hypothetical protein
VDWPQAERLVHSLQPESRAALLRVLQASEESRAAFIGSLYQQTGGGLMAELLIEFEERGVGETVDDPGAGGGRTGMDYQDALREALKQHPDAYAIYSESEDPLRLRTLDEDEAAKLMREDGATMAPASLDEQFNNDWKYDGQRQAFRILRRPFAERLARP